MFYSPKFFWDTMPKWKRKKDNIFCKILYRPISFLVSSFCSSIGISANAISYFNILVAISSAVLFLFGQFWLGIIGAILVNLWIVLDCADGNIARSVRKQPYGEYADSVSSYFLVPLLAVCSSLFVFFQGGILFHSGNVWIVLVGCIAGVSDTMMRLCYHKFKEVTQKMVDLGVVDETKDDRNDHSKVTSFKTIIECYFGIGGIIPLFLLFSVIFSFTDLFVIYCCVYYGGCFLLSFGLNTIKAMKHGSKTFTDPTDKD